MQYDTEGNVLESSKESATFRQVKRFAYDERGNLLAARDQNGGVRQISWNAQNLPDLITDALGRETRFQYGADGSLVQASSPADAGHALRLDLTANDGSNVVAPNGARTRYVKDDFGRTVAIDSADSGLLSRTYDLADRIVASRDAAGNRASYEYDVAGRIVLQTVSPLAPAKPLVTRWAYQGKRMVLLEDPEQTERYAYETSGRLASRSVTIKLDNGTAVTNVTRYTYDQIGQVESESLPDGSFINYKRNGQNQVVALERCRIRTAWLQWMLPAKPIASQIESDLVGIKQFSYGNGIEALYQRSAQGALARIVYRQPASRSGALKIAATGTLEGLLGVTPAYAAAADPATLKVGALGLRQENAALLDHRFLWDIQGNLLHKLGKTGRDNYAYDDHDRLIASATTGNTTQAGGARFSRYHYDGAGNRLLGQEDIDSQDDTTHTRVSDYAPGTNRWLGDKDAAQQAHYDAVGRGKAPYGRTDLKLWIRADGIRRGRQLL